MQFKVLMRKKMSELMKSILLVVLGIHEKYILIVHSVK